MCAGCTNRVMGRNASIITSTAWSRPDSCWDAFISGCSLRQRICDKLEQKIRAIAERERSHAKPNVALEAMRSNLVSVRTKRERAGQNLGLADGAEQFRAVAAVFDDLKQQESNLEAKIVQLEKDAKIYDFDGEIATALAGLDRISEIAATAQTRFDSIRYVGVPAYERSPFSPIFRVLIKKAHSQQGDLRRGDIRRITPPPVPIYNGPTGHRNVKDLGETPARDGSDSSQPTENSGGKSGEEGNSLGNVNRGDWI